MAGLEDVLGVCLELDELLTEKCDKSERKEIILNHLKSVSSKLKFNIPDFGSDLTWLNVSEPLSLSTHLEGKLLVLDFFTYCCINCMHILPHLEELEQKFPIQKGLVVIGVHSAKFLNEKSTSNILNAVLRYGIEHPVVNDSEALLWNKLQISCWPTFVIVGPQKEFLFTIAGEKNKDLLFEFVEVSLQYFNERSELKSHELPLLLEKDKKEKSCLHFPGKVSVAENNELIISDTANNCILVVTETGIVKEKIGGVKGYLDGSFEEAMFSSPQGTASFQNLIFVADTDNHAIRQIDLVEKRVDTIVGTGKLGNDLEGGKTGTLQEISSPWDLSVATTPNSAEPDVLYIAMSGTHQIWVYFLKDTVWYKNQHFKAKTCIRFAGSGLEENRNNNYPQKAGFAQPSGLDFSPKSFLNILFIADAESSSIRQILLKDGTVKGLIGGEQDPNNLFAFGDKDGVGVEAKLQHPLGVSLLSPEGPLLVADSYNHKLKSVDLTSKQCSTVIGCGLPGNRLSDNLLEVKLNEPGGVCVNQKKQLVYIADTNNHSIKVFDLTAKTIHEFPVIVSNATEEKKSSESAVKADRTLDSVSVNSDCELSVELIIHLSHGEHLNEEAPNSWRIIFTDHLGKKTIKSGSLTASHRQTVTEIMIPQTLDEVKMSVTLVLQLFVCKDDQTCTVRTAAVEQPLNIVQSESGKSGLMFEVDTANL